MVPSFWQIALVVILVLLLFGRGKISALMGDLAQGIKSFKSGLADDDKPKTLDQSENEKVEPSKSQDKQTS